MARRLLNGVAPGDRASGAGRIFVCRVHLLSLAGRSSGVQCCVSRVASYVVEGEDPNYDAESATLAACFPDNRWDEYPEYEASRAFARLDGCGPDFTALGLVAAHGGARCRWRRFPLR